MKDILEDVKRIVLEASALIDFRRLEIIQKGPKENFATSIDLKIQEFLNEKLVGLIEGSVVFGEENAENSLSQYTWIVDPIDGTVNLIRDIPNYAISVGLLYQGEIILGVVLNPKSNELFYAQKNQGAFLNGKPIKTSNKEFKDGLLCTAMSLYKKEYAPVCFDIISEAYDECLDVRRFGSCALELCYLAMGRIDLYFEIRVFPWDYAGASIILTEAGGKYGSIDRVEITHDKPIPFIAANNECNLVKMKKIVNKHINEVLYGK
mgnify:CR=1 FL=1